MLKPWLPKLNRRRETSLRDAFSFYLHRGLKPTATIGGRSATGMQVASGAGLDGVNVSVLMRYLYNFSAQRMVVYSDALGE